MDLAELWQQHKGFLLTIVGALVVMLIGTSVISDRYPVSSLRSKSSGIQATLNTTVNVPDADVRELRGEVESLRVQIGQLVQEMQFDGDELFELPATEPNPTSYCFVVLRRVQDELVDHASRQNISVPEKLGLQDAAPADPDDIRRTLRALNVIQSVVLAGIDSGVRRIARIQIDPAHTGVRQGAFYQELGVQFDIVGSERSLQAVLAQVVEEPKLGRAPYLAVQPGTKLEPSKQEPGLYQLHLDVAALAIDTTELGLDESDWEGS